MANTYGDEIPTHDESHHQGRNDAISSEGEDIRIPWNDLREISESPVLARMQATDYHDALAAQISSLQQTIQQSLPGLGDLPVTVHLHRGSQSKADNKALSTHPNASFKYPCLTPGQRFRTIILLAAKDANSEIRCRLADMSLDTPPVFEAVSYVWGPQDKLLPISLDGSPFFVSDRLLGMLQTFREPSRNRMLWIDAICVNQASTEDRDRQVSQMDLIYSRAATVTIWFGSASRRTEFAFACVEVFADTLKNRRPTTNKMDKFFTSLPGAKICCAIAAGLGNIWETACQGPAKMGAGSYSLRNLADDPGWFQPIQLLLAALTHKKSALLFDELRLLVENDWWHRVWVLQEASLGRNVEVQLSGYTIAWETLREMLLCVAQLGIGDNRYFLFHEIKLRDSLQYSLHLTSQLTQFALPFFLFAEPSFRPSLETLLVLSASLNATDGRDRAFSLYGLLDKRGDERELIKPDYGLSYQKIMTRLARNLLQRDKTLDVLAAKNDWFPDLPSWVPTWNIDSGLLMSSNATSVALGHCSAYGARRPGADRLYCASLYEKCPSSYTFKFTTSEEVFILGGIRVSRISAMTDALDVVMGVSHRNAKSQFRDQPDMREHLSKLNMSELDTEHGKDDKSEDRADDEGFDRYYNHATTTTDNSQVKPILDPFQAHAADSQRTLWSHWLDFGDARSSDSYAFPPFHASSSAPHPHTKSEAFYRTILLDRQWQHSSLTSTSTAVTSHLVRLPTTCSAIEIPFMERWPPQDSDDEQTLLYYLFRSQSSHITWEGFSAHCLGQRLMKTQDGHLGIAPEGAKVGDWVVVAFGGHVPLLLRHSRRHWVFVGHCYVHGIMDGEVVVQMNDRGEEPETFALI